jgi:hypothetical protein
MWIMLYDVCGALAAAMDSRIIRDEERINSTLRPKTAFESLCSTPDSLTITKLVPYLDNH